MRDPDQLLTPYYYKHRKQILAARKRRYQTDAAYRAMTIARAKAAAAARIKGRAVPLLSRAKAVAELSKWLARHRPKECPVPEPRPPRPVIQVPKRPRAPLTELKQRLVRKLREGKDRLTAAELALVPPRRRAQAAVVKPRTLAEIGALFGVTKQRVQQILDAKIPRRGRTADAPSKYSVRR